MIRSNASPLAMAIVLLASGATATAQHSGDIFLGIEDGQIVTGAVDSDQTVTTPVRVFNALFGDSGCQAFTANPGFDTFAGTFEPGTKLGWHATAGWQVWNGNGFESAGGEFVNVSFLSLDFDVADGPVDGFDLFVQANGGFHVHLDFCLNDCPEGCAAPAGADPGVYLLELVCYSTDPSLTTSDPFWLVFDFVAPAGAQDAASAWLVDQLGTSCASDFNDDGMTDVVDLVAMILNWGECPGCVEDITGDNAVDVQDLVALILAWGACQ